MAAGQDDFLTRVASVGLTPREVFSIWLNLVRARKTGRIPDWREEELLIVTTGKSVDWTSVRSDLFPCLLPTMKYTLLVKGSIASATSKLCLSLQGVEDQEIEWLGISELSSSRQQDFAGNMFTTNVLTACWVAAALYL